MSPLDRSGARRALLALVVSTGAPVAAQTIADYSHAQRAAIESAMVQSTMRYAASPVAPAVATPSSPSTVVRHGLYISADEPSVQVSGVFASAARTVVEIAVNGTPYILSAGQVVPGTSWQVDAIATDRVALIRTASRDRGPGERRDQRRTYLLPSLVSRVVEAR